jgi:ELWxxDGT repeat protein
MIILSVLTACTNDPSSKTESGAIRVNIKWEETDEPTADIERSAIDCGLRDIANVSVAVLPASGGQSLAGGSWPCNQHSGMLTNISPADGLVVEVRGLDADNKVKFYARELNVRIQASNITTVNVTLEAVSLTPAISMLKDVYTGAKGSHPHQLKPLGNLLFFVARQPDTDFELFVTDGTEAGTQLVRDISPQPAGAPYAGPISMPSDLTELNGRLYFFADDGISGPSLWQTDGSTENTLMIDNFTDKGIANPSHLTALNDKLFFTAEHSDFGRELWTSDGTATGTRMVHDIFPGTQSSTPHELVTLDNWLYFAADDDTHGIEIWRTNTDGTTVELVQDIHTRALQDNSEKTKDSYSGDLTVVNGRVFCRAVEGSTGEEIWMISANDTGSRADLVVDLNASDENSSRPRSLAAINDTYLAFSAKHIEAGETETQTGYELWLFDWLTNATPIRVTDINPGIGSSNPANFISMNDMLYFTANNSLDERHLWALPLGTAGIPVCLTQGMVDPAPQHLTVFEGLLYFTAFEDSTGRELWYTDGTTAARVDDLCPGTCSSSPTNFAVLGNHLYFSAYETERGKELYQLHIDYIVDTSNQDKTIAMNP